MRDLKHVYEHAGLPANSDSKGSFPYRPSNGSEGEIFTSRWCAVCQKDSWSRGGETSCSILSRSLLGETVRQWKLVSRVPICASFQHYQAPKPKSSAAKRLEKHGQMSIFQIEPTELVPGLSVTDEYERSPPSPSTNSSKILSQGLLEWLETINSHNLTLMTRLMGKPHFKSLISQLQVERQIAQKRIAEHHEAIAQTNTQRG